MSSTDFRKRSLFKTRRCRHFGDDGRVKRDPCPLKSADCHFVHPDDPEWMLTPIYPKPYFESHRDRDSSSRHHGRGRDYSPVRRDGGWGDRDGVKERDREREREREREKGRDRERDRERDSGRNRSRSSSRRRAYLSPPRVRRESSIASSRSDAAATTDISSTPVLSTEPAVPRTSKVPPQSPIFILDHRAGKPSSSSSISVGANYSFRPPPPPSVTPPLPPPPPPTADPVRSPTVPSSWPTTTPQPVTSLIATSGSLFTLPPLPPSTTTSVAVPPPSSAISTTSSIPPSTNADIPSSSASSTGFLQKEQQRTPIFIKSSKPFNSQLASASPISASPNLGAASVTAATLNTPVTTSNSVVSQQGTTVSTTTTDQPLNIDISLAPASSFDSIPGLSPAGETPTIHMPITPSGQSQPQLQQQSDSIPQSLPPVPSLPPLPNFEQSETTVPELSNEAKIELWNKRTKAMAEILVHNEKALRLTSDIDDLKRYSTSSFFASDPDDKKRIEANIAKLEASRESARQAMQKGLDALTGSDTWPSALVVEKVQKDNEKMKEYVSELVDAMTQVGETLKELADTAGMGAGKGRRRRRRVKAKEKVGEKEKDEGTEKEKETGEEKESLIPSNAMVVDEVSTPTETNNVRKRSVLDDEDDTLIQPDDLDEIRAKFTSLNELWQGVSDSLGQAESEWMMGVKEMYQDLVQAQKRTIRSRIEQYKSQVDQHATRLKSDLSQVDTKIETTNKNADKMVDETTQALEKILKLREERDTLLADHQTFFKEELPNYKARFVAYDAQREKDQKRFTALEAALNAYVNRPPSPVVEVPQNTISSLGSLETMASTGSTSSLPTSISSATAASASSTTNTNSSHSDTKVDASDYPLAFNNIKPQLINILRESVKPLVEEIRRQVEEMMNAQKEEMYANMWSKVEFTWQILAKVQKTAEVDIGALLAGVNLNGGGEGSRGENGAAAAADVIMKAARDAPASTSPSGPHLAGIPMETSAGPNTSIPTALAAAATHGGGARGDSVGNVAGAKASAGAR